MTPRRLMLLAGSLAVAVLAWWLAPAVLAFVGLGDAGMVGQVCLTVLALSGLETALQRLNPPPTQQPSQSAGRSSGRTDP